MNITTIYKEMENRNNLNLSVYLGYLQDHVNSPSFLLEEVLGKEKKYLRALSCAAFDIKKPELLFNLITKDPYVKVFSSHMCLIKCSAELLNPHNSHKDLEILIDHVVDAVKCARINDPGITLSFAFGFVLGTAIKRGINVKSFFNKLDASFIIDNDRLFNGLHYGLSNKSTTLVLNDPYIFDLSDRYDNWDDRSRILSLSIFKSIPTEHLTTVAINENNLKVLAYFSGRNSSYDNFFKNYQLEIKQLNLPKKVLPVAIDGQSKTPSDSHDININDNLQQKEQEIASLKKEISLYQSIFQQFEVLFPDLQKTLSHDGNNQELLQKIKNLVEQKQNNMTQLQSYFEDSEKQKTIKDNFKKML